MEPSSKRKPGAQNRVQDLGPASLLAYILEACHSLARGCRQKKREIGLSNSEPCNGGFSRTSLWALTMEE